MARLPMHGLGNRLRARAEAVGLTDTEVACRAELAQSRYAKYVIDGNEPDLGTLVRICRVLATTPDELLGFGRQGEASERGSLEAAVMASTAAMDVQTLKVAVVLLDALSRMEGSGKEVPGTPKATSRRDRRERTASPG